MQWFFQPRMIKVIYRQDFSQIFYYIADAKQKLHSQSLVCKANIITKQSSDPGPEVKKLFSCSAELSLKFKLLINTKIAQIY